MPCQSGTLGGFRPDPIWSDRALGLYITSVFDKPQLSKGIEKVLTSLEIGVILLGLGFFEERRHNNNNNNNKMSSDNASAVADPKYLHNHDRLLVSESP